MLQLEGKLEIMQNSIAMVAQYLVNIVYINKITVIFVFIVIHTQYLVFLFLNNC